MSTQEVPRPRRPVFQATGISQDSGLEQRLLPLQGDGQLRASPGSAGSGVLEPELLEPHTVLVSLCHLPPTLEKKALRALGLTLNLEAVSRCSCQHNEHGSPVTL